jgi:hypothetical protein
MNIPTVPDMVILNPDEVSDKMRKRICIHMVKTYTSILETYILAKSTGCFIEEDIDEEIRFCQSNILWLENLSDKNNKGY